MQIACHDCTQQTGSPYQSQNMFDSLQVEIAGIQAVFRFLTVQFYVAGPSDPLCASWHRFSGEQFFLL
jgi:hypothetical protein